MSRYQQHWIAPGTIDTETVCLSISVPINLRMYVSGALLLLTKEENWEPSASVDAETIARVFELAFYEIGADCMPIGAITPFGGVVAPSGWLICNGAEYDRADYPALYDVLPAAQHRPGDRFAVYNLEDQFVLGAASVSHGDTGGSETVALTTAQMPAHTHDYLSPTFNVDVESVGVPDPTGVGLPQNAQPTTSAGSGEPHNNMPPYLALTMIIKAR